MPPPESALSESLSGSFQVQVGVTRHGKGHQGSIGEERGPLPTHLDLSWRETLPWASCARGGWLSPQDSSAGRSQACPAAAWAESLAFPLCLFCLVWQEARGRVSQAGTDLALVIFPLSLPPAALVVFMASRAKGIMSFRGRQEQPHPTAQQQVLQVWSETGSERGPFLGGQPVFLTANWAELLEELSVCVYLKKSVYYLHKVLWNPSVWQSVL